MHLGYVHLSLSLSHVTTLQLVENRVIQMSLDHEMQIHSSEIQVISTLWGNP